MNKKYLCLLPLCGVQAFLKATVFVHENTVLHVLFMAAPLCLFLLSLHELCLLHDVVMWITIHTFRQSFLEGIHRVTLSCTNKRQK